MGATNFVGWLSETTLAVIILLLVILLIRKPFAKLFGARAAYALWLAPLVRIFMPELAILTPPESAVDFASYVYATTPAITETVAPNAYPVGALLTGTGLFLWVIIAIAIFGYKLESQVRFTRSMLANSTTASEQLNANAKEIAKDLGLKHTPMLRICAEEYGPAVIGLLRPILFLPRSFENRFSANEQRLALAHELAHIARGDMTTTFIAYAFQAVQWPNPLVYFAMRAFRIDQEAACDAFVLRRWGRNEDTTGEYASAILKSVNAHALPAHGLSLGNPVKERLMLLKNIKTGPLHAITGSIGAAALVLGGLAATANYSYAADDDKTEKKKEMRIVSDKNVVMHKDGGVRAIIIDGEHDGAKLIKKHVIVTPDGHKGLTSETNFEEGEFIVYADDESGAYNIEIIGDSEHTGLGASGGEHLVFHGKENCASSGDGDEPVILEWSDESANDKEKLITKSVICLTGDEAAPEKRAEALRKAINQMDEEGKRQAERHKKMIDGLRKQLAKLEKESRKKK